MNEEKDVKQKLMEIARSFVMVYNPTNEDYVVLWSQSGMHGYPGGHSEGEAPQNWVIPHKDSDSGYGNGKKEVPYFIAEKYAREMTDKIINETLDKEMEKQRRKWKSDPGEFATWWGNSYRQIVKVDFLKEELRKKLILGITRKYSDNVQVVQRETRVNQEDPIDVFENIGSYEDIQENKANLIAEVSE